MLCLSPMDRHQSSSPESDHDPQHAIADLKDALDRSQSDIEQEKVAMARVLHDDFGGLLVGAIMDIGWVSQQVGHSELVKEKLLRAVESLRAAIDLKRELIETLRPTLLDNVGLFSTLRWHLKARCDAAGVVYVESLPSSERTLPSDFRTGVFRIFQETLKHILAEGAIRELSLDVHVINDTLHCHLRSDAIEPLRTEENVRVAFEASMRHRAQRIGGTLRWLKTAGGNHIHLQFPLAPSTLPAF